MTGDELEEVLEKHRKWLADAPGGVRADLQNAVLRCVDLSNVDLSNADLSEADLRDVNLNGADLRGANLQGADLRGADLSNADLRIADLRGAALRGARLWDTDLRDANLDYSCWPLWCGSLEVKIDKSIACQLLYHALRAMQSVDDTEVSAVCNNPDVVALANKFYHARECGKFAPTKEE